MKVLVTDANYKHALASIRSLGRRKIQVDAGSEKAYAAGFFSKYCRRRVVYPDPNNENAFINFMRRLVSKEEYDVLIPVGLAVTSRLSKFKRELSPYVKIPVVDYDVFQIAADKSKSQTLAEDLGIPVPKTLCPTSLNDVKEIAPKVGYPVVVKSRTEVGKMCYANSPSELINGYAKLRNSTSLKEDLPLVQEYLPGIGYGLFALFNKGKPRAFFMHKRIKEYPITGGPSVVAESVFIPELKEYGLKLLSALKWHGTAMVEFRRDFRDRKFKLMEVNPKLWGSLDLAIACGVDFPYLLCKMSVDGDVNPIFDYRIGVKYAWIFPDAALLLLASPQSFKTVARQICHGTHNVWTGDIKPNVIQALETWYDIAGLLYTSGTVRYPRGRPRIGLQN